MSNDNGKKVKMRLVIIKVLLLLLMLFVAYLVFFKLDPQELSMMLQGVDANR